MKQQELLKSANDCALKIMESVLDVEFFKEPYSHCVIDNFFPPAFACNFGKFKESGNP